MSTRSIVVVHDEKAAVRLYRHCDGYPAANLQTIAEAIQEARKVNPGAGALGIAASLLEAGVRFEQEEVVPKISVEMLGNQGDLEWCYFVDAASKSIAVYGGRETGTPSEHVARGQADPYHSLATMLPSFAASPAFLARAQDLYEHISAEPAAGQMREALNQEAEQAKADPKADRYVKEQAWKAVEVITSQIAYMNVDAGAIREAKASLEAMAWTINDQPLSIEAECKEDARWWIELNRMIKHRTVHTALIDDKESMPKGPLDGPIIELGDFFMIQRVRISGAPVLLLHERKDFMADHLSEGVGYRIEYGAEGSASIRPQSMVRAAGGPSMG